MYEDKTSRLSIVCEEIPNSADIARTIGVKYYFTGVPCRARRHELAEKSAIIMQIVQFIKACTPIEFMQSRGLLL